MFDFLFLKLSALQNNPIGSDLRLAQIMISNTQSLWNACMKRKTDRDREGEMDIKRKQAGQAVQVVTVRVRIV